MTTAVTTPSIRLDGTNITIDWGDGNEDNIPEAEYYLAPHLYTTSGPYTITITGGVTHLECPYNGLTQLEINNCPGLVDLTCRDNQLASLDVSGCPGLEYIHCLDNRLDATALNALFESLPDQISFLPESCVIVIGGNDGTYTCVNEITEDKNWTVSEN